MNVGYSVLPVVYLHCYGEFESYLRRFLWCVQFGDKVMLEYFGDALQKFHVHVSACKDVIYILSVAVQPPRELAHTYARFRHSFLYQFSNMFVHGIANLVQAIKNRELLARYRGTAIPFTTTRKLTVIPQASHFLGCKGFENCSFRYTRISGSLCLLYVFLFTLCSLF